MNLAENAEAYAAGTNLGWVESAWAGIQESIEILAERKIKVVINGGSLNPSGLAQKVALLAKEKGLEDLKVAFVEGDNLLPILGNDLASLKKDLPPHLDSDNPDVKLPWNLLGPNSESVPLVSANAYLGARAIVQGLRDGADIIICGRVADASPVIGAAWYWHSWKDTDYDRLAGALISGHLIECSAYVSGGNFSGFTEYDLNTFIEPGFPITEIDADGACVITKHEGTGGMINEDTVKCQFLYELQGSIYLNSDVKAYLNDVRIQRVGKDRVRVSGIKGAPPPPTTKATIFYQGGYQSQILVNATGYGTAQKWQLFETQLRRKLSISSADKDLSILEFQIESRVGTPQPNPKSQLNSTTYMRVFAESHSQEALMSLLIAFRDISLQHFSGFHSALDMRTAIPKPFLAMYPALILQNSLKETVTFCDPNNGAALEATNVGYPPKYSLLERRENIPTTYLGKQLSSFGPTKPVRLGDIVLARSGDKGSNLNVGFFVHSARAWEWLRSFLSSSKMVQLMGDDWSDEYFLERVEFENIFAVHFVVYGILGRGVSGSTRLDSLGKAFADYVRDKVVDVPVEILYGSKM
ncbi:DUF1446-domain-containing protein [Mollisia scopiformis]|uniref:DUF1446-domain-containing protein n=1 Tax=Mollisia scopiformis TaxID=149040 RepID=A0A132B7A0_MOLSC|nr:DUF1446-domain-containing protein [Mollisia scopiformis]KUJ08285.1 DUF1446-domain-containing protein [Mollisia scopiformis]